MFIKGTRLEVFTHIPRINRARTTASECPPTKLFVDTVDDLLELLVSHEFSYISLFFQGILLWSVLFEASEYDACGTVESIWWIDFLEKRAHDLNNLILSLGMSPESLVQTEDSSLFVSKSDNDMVGLEIFIYESLIRSLEIHHEMIPYKALVWGFMIIETPRRGYTLVRLLSLGMKNIHASELQPDISAILAKNLPELPESYFEKSCYISFLHQVS